MSEGRLPAGVAFETRAVRGGRSRSGLATLAWLGALAGLVGVGMSGRGEALVGTQPATVLGTVATEGLPADAVAAEAIAAADRAAPPRRGPATVQDPSSPVELLSPAANRIARGEGTFEVVGRSLVRVARVAIYVETGGGRIYDRAAVRLPDLSDVFRPDEQPTFRATFALPTAPSTTIWIVIAAYNTAGSWIGTLRQPIIVGAAPLGIRVAAPLSH